MNIEHWIAQLEGNDPRAAIAQLGKISPGLARPAVPALVELFSRGDRVLGNEAARLAIHIGPDHAGDISAVLQFLLADKPRGWMLPDVASAFERLACRAPDTVELLGEALAYPHFRVRVAAARGLASMGTLLEFVEQPLLRAIEGPSRCVTQAVSETLLSNRQSLSPRLEAVLDDHAPDRLSPSARAAADEMERAVWRPRASRLNGLGDDGEDAVFFLRRRTTEERGLSDAAFLEQLLGNHDLTASARSISKLTTTNAEQVLAKLLHPLFSPDLVTGEPIDATARRFGDFFNAGVRVYSNAIVQDGTVHDYQPVSGCLIDAGLIWTDDVRVGMFWVADED